MHTIALYTFYREHLMHFFVIISFFFSLPVECMETMPNEVTRMFFEHLQPKQRLSITRVCRIWTYLIMTFPKLQISEKFKVNAWMERDMNVKGIVTQLCLIKNADKKNLHLELDSFDAIDWADSLATQQNCQIAKIGLPIKFPYKDDLRMRYDHVPLDNTSLQDSRICALVLSLRECSEAAAKSFFEKLCQYPQITHLTLQDDYHIQFLTHNNTIDSLTLDDSSNSCKCLKDFIASFSLVKRLNLTIYYGECLNVAYFIENNNTIEEIELSSSPGTGISCNTAQKLIDAMAKNSTITCLDLREGKIDPKYDVNNVYDKRVIF